MTAPFRSLPDADEVFAVAMADGAALPVYGLAGPAGAPVMLFGHANGLAAGSYAPWLRRLAQRLRVFAFDARGHGGASWPAGPLDEVFSIDRMADDLGEVTRAVAARAAVARVACIGHSLGAAAALRLAACGRAPQWSALVAFEPPIFPLPSAPDYAETVAKQARLVAGTAKRRVRWPNPEALCERLQSRGMFARFSPEMLHAHCRATLRPDAQGGFVLCCPPEIEAFIFRSHGEADTWSRLGQIGMAVDLVGGDPAMPDNDWVSGALPAIGQAITNARLTVMHETGHMLIAEAPERCAALLFERFCV